MKRLRFFAMITAVALTLSLCSCNIIRKFTSRKLPDTVKQYTDMPDHSGDIGMHDDEDGYHIVNRVDFSYDTGYEAKRVNHSYDALDNDSQREMYALILDGVYCFSDKDGKFDGEYKMRPMLFSGDNVSDKDVETALTAVLDDHPEIFWMSTDFESIYVKEDTVGVTLNANYTADQVVGMMRELDTALSGYFADFERGLSEYEREESVYRYIISNCTYDDGVENSDDYSAGHPSIYNLYGVMVDKKAVCEGYSRALDYLCSELGTDTVCICGTADTEDDEDVDAASGLHMWNAVQLDNEWYWVDCTWDDWDEDEDLGDVYYYLNVTDDVLFADHTVDKTYEELTEDEYWELESYINNFVPSSCTATKYCYYLLEGELLASPNAEQLCEGFVTAANKGRKSLLVILDTDQYTPDTMADALFDGDQPYYQALDLANEKLSGVQLDADADAVYYTDDVRKILIFEIFYE